MRRIGPLVTLALTLLLAACGGGALDPRPFNTPGPAIDASATPEPSPTATPRVTPTATSTPQRNSTPVTLADVAPFTRSYVRTTWNYLSGAGTARALYDLFTPDCQRMVSLTALEHTPAVVQTVYRGLQGKNIEDVEFAIPLNLRATSASLEIKLPLRSQTRFRIDGNWLTQYEWLRQLNPSAAVDQSETLAVSPSGDSLRIASCEHLKQWDQQR
jgi:hypothetical protein